MSRVAIVDQPDGQSINRRVVAVVVCFNPVREFLDRLLGALVSQVQAIVVVDNNSDESPQPWLLARYQPHIIVRRLKSNVGVASAQNIGIQEARSLGAQFVLLMDQDSEPAADMVGRLADAAADLIARGHALAAVGPRYVDSRSQGAEPFIQRKGFRSERCRCEDVSDVIPVEHVIASGCLIPMATLDAVGGMRDELFIDYVDIEWCLRASRMGFQSFGVCAAEMRHALGEAYLRWQRKEVPLHSPLRSYYQVRNAIWMLRQPWLKWQWKLQELRTLLLRYAFLAAFAPLRVKRIALMTIGVWHGIRGRMGPLG